MMDQYKERYKTETEEIHAPADLIARTKAAVREEEARIQREFAAQEAELAGQPAKPVAQNGRFPAQEVSVMPQKNSRGATARRWAYPLSAAAAIIVLASVSLMMRGLEKSSSDSAPSFESAAVADSGAAESAAAGAAEEGAFDEAFPEESAAATESAAVDTEAEAAEELAAEEAAGAVAEADDAASDMGMAFADAAGEAETAEQKKRAADGLSAGEGEIENAMSQKQEAKGTLANTAAEITVEKVWKKPAFVSRKDVETRNYEDMVFQIVEEEDGWAAYVESETGGGYVIRGEAESIDAFLEAGYKRLEEISW